MKPIICFGEALIDFLNTDKSLEDNITINTFQQFPGGAPANAAVAAAKLGGKSLFMGQVGEDEFGNFLEASLNNYNVDTRYLFRHPSAKTALAFVTLDNDGERSFSFYRHETADILFPKENISEAWFSKDTIFHFCSNTLTDEIIASTTKKALDVANKKQALISFDVNLRHNLWANNQVDIDVVNDLVMKSHLLKFSMEEIEYLSQGNVDKYIEQCLSANCQLVVVTDGKKKIHYRTTALNGHISPPSIDAIDTTAGGDGFIGGMLYLLSQCENIQASIHCETTLKSILNFSSFCGAMAVSRKGAFPALPTLEDVQQLTQKKGLTNNEFINKVLRENI